MSAPLDGVKVIELARILAGPWIGQTLADLGADVIKVESPNGDDTRGWGPPFVKGENGEDLDAAYFHSCNRGKRSIAVDFRNPEGQETVRKLVASADILVENFKVGGLEKYGLDYASLREINPRLIYCSVTGFGQDGPYAHRAGYDRDHGPDRRPAWRAPEDRGGFCRHLHRTLRSDRCPCGASPSRYDRAW